MNKLSPERQAQIIALITEGNSLRATARLTKCSIVTVVNLFCAVGRACERFHQETVVNIKAKRVQVDEIWSFVYAKEKNAAKASNPEAGDCWTWTAIDAQTKLIISWMIGRRDADTAGLFMDDVASRLANRVQLTSDGHRAYLDAVEHSFEGNIDFAQLVKVYGKPTRENGKKDNRTQYIGSERTVINGRPDIKHITTSHVERQNLTMRMHMRRFTRKTNAFSKKLQNHQYAIAIHFVYYNFVRFHSTLRVTPAMEAGLMDKWMEIKDMIDLIKRFPDNKYL
jgi:IS1 family transposase